MNNRSVDIIKDLIVAFFVSVILMAAGLKISLVFLFFIPIPFIVMSIRNGQYAGIIGVGLYSILMAIFGEAFLGVSLFIMFMPVVFIIQYLVIKKEKIEDIVLLSGFVFLVSLLLILTFESRVTGIDIRDQMMESLDMVLETQINVLKETDISKYKLAEIEDNLKNTYKFTMTLMPALLIISSFIMAYLNYKISIYIVNKTDYRGLEVPDFSKLMLPESFLIGSAIMFMFTFLAKKLEMPYHNALLTNVGVLVSLSYLIQGTAVISYFLKKFRLNKFLRIIIILMLVLILPVGGLFVMLGMVDSVFDMRKIRGKTS